MPARIILQHRERGNTYGRVVPLLHDKDGEPYHGLPVGHWGINAGEIYIDLLESIDTIVHEVATRKAVRAEIRAANKVAKGEEHPFHVEYDPITKRFKQVEE